MYSKCVACLYVSSSFTCVQMSTYFAVFRRNINDILYKSLAIFKACFAFTPNKPVF